MTGRALCVLSVFLLWALLMLWAAAAGVSVVPVMVGGGFAAVAWGVAGDLHQHQNRHRHRHQRFPR